MASPFVAGAAALVKSQRPSVTASEIAQLLYDNAEDIGVGGIGSGRLDLTFLDLDEVTIVSDSLKDGLASTAYNDTLQATGGTGSYTWSITDGALPIGLELASDTGVIDGVPTATATASFTVQVDDGSTTDSKEFSISVYNDISISTTSLPDGAVKSAYSKTLTASGGKTPYSWSIVSGSLPAGLSLGASTGKISGTPTAYGNYSFIIRARDSFSPANTAQKNFSLYIALEPLAITTTYLPDGTTGKAYSRTLASSGGTSGKSWRLTSGTFPPGLNLNSTSGKISGTPNKIGTYTFTIQLKDSQTSVQKEFTITINTPLRHPSGTLVKTNSSPTVYLISGDTKSTFTSAASFLSHRYSWEQLVMINSTELNIYTTAAPMQIRSGTLVKGNHATVYLINEDMTKSTFPTADVFLNRGYSWDQIIQSSDAELVNYPMGEILGGSATNTIIKITNSPIVYMVDNGQRRPFASAETFLGMGYTWNQIRTVTSSQLNQYPLGAIVHLTHPAGTLVKTPNSTTVYYLDNEDGITVKRAFPTPASYFSYGFDWGQIVTIRTEESSSYRKGTDMSIRDGTLVKGSKNAVYVIEYNKKRIFPSAAVFTALGYNWNNIRTIENSVLNGLATGPNM